MPEITLELTDQQAELLDTIRKQQGLETMDQAAEWLIKQRMRGASLKLTGRNRALHAVGGPRK
ncbi:MULTISPECIES: hypothetical protein [Marinobacter]|jgi:hypothetical protein|uniref:CopG family transcriptional regulator n=1 Tax=Marinobacter nauticus TaxID=2743 RepID=A0A368V9N1_MARNT|nr:MULTISPECIES: hypothetical protein [Marinobacter]MEC9040082.1 hypothetical protein [Pseudomonadota bacterium]RBP76982.1 hypothetical protein DET64_101166 [Marinobacter nauticus]RCW37828.1 hypothetical protein DET51_101165 [Marinobacter nauticus]